MQVTVTIHEAWLARPEDLRRVMALLAGLEVRTARAQAAARTTTARAARPSDDDEETFYPEGRAPARGSRTGDDAWAATTTGREDAAGRWQAAPRLGRRSRSRT